MHAYVTVIMPVKNEAKFIERSLAAVLSQDYPAEYIEILVADGMSTDGTRETIEEAAAADSRIRLVDNPALIMAAGFNAALRLAKGEVVVVVGGHTELAPEYLSRSVAYLQENGVDCVGGYMETIAATSIGHTIAIAMSSSFGVGGVAFRTQSDVLKEVDTVAFGAYRREIIDRAGPLDEELIRNQDDEYNYRLRKLGAKIIQVPDLHVRYHSRSSLPALWRQYFQYGFWKVRVLQKHPFQMRPRQFVPPAFVLGLLGAGLLAVAPVLRNLSLVVPSLYVLANLTASVITSAKKGWRHLPFLPLVFAILHFGYGLGFLIGLLKFWNRWGDEQSQPSPVPSLVPSLQKPGFFRRLSGLMNSLSVGRPDGRPAGETIQPARSFPVPSLWDWWGFVVKRLFDVLVSALGLVLLSPVFALLSYLIKRESPGPVFYRGPRLGKDGKPFGILKFRTMYDRPESYRGPRLTAQGDSRITPIGRWLRETKLNELPQLWNVLVGDMSLVGPRPEDPEIARNWPTRARLEVFSVKPGITSPASVIYRDEENMLPAGAADVLGDYLRVIMPDKLRLDQLYVRNRHFLSDLDVIFLTLIMLLPNLRRKPIPPEAVFNGLLDRFVRRYFSWFLVDNLVAFTAVGLAGVLWRLGGPIELGLPEAIVRAAGIALLFSLVNMRMGLGRVLWGAARPGLVFNLAFSSAVSTLLVTLVDWLLPEVHPIPLGLVVAAGVLAFLGFVGVRYRERLLTGFASQWIGRRANREPAGQRVLIVGAGECALLALWLLRRSKPAPAFSIVGMVDDDTSKTGMSVGGHTVLGLTRRIPEIVERRNVGMILFAIETIQPEEQRRILDLCRQTPARLVLFPDLLSLFRERLSAAAPTASTAAFSPHSPGEAWGEAD